MRMMSSAATPRMSANRLKKTLTKGFEAHRRGDLMLALGHYKRVLEADPHNAAALHYAALLGRTLNQLAKAEGKTPRDEEVRRLMALSIAEAPRNAAGIHNFAKFEQDVGNVAVARELYERAVAVDPHLAESWTNLGNIFGELGNRMRAEACWQRALECPRGSPDSAFNLSFLKLLKGDFEGGWRDYENRWLTPEFVHSYGRPDLKARRWKGPGDRVRRLYLHGEQGAGDVIMMSRYIPQAAECCDELTVEVLRGLVSLFEVMFPYVKVVARGDEPTPHDAQLPMMSLPFVFETSIATIPSPAGALFRTPEPRRVGLCWRGSTTHVNDRLRSMPFEATFPFLDVPGIAWQSLQFGYETSEPLEPCPLGDFLETARAIARCELVITVDTSVAHLAGTMGVPTWLLVPFHAEWRWLQERDDSPWYPSMKLFRQDIAGDWPALVQRVAAALVERYSLTPSP